MSSYIKQGKPLEYDNAPDWLIGYMRYRRTVLNGTQTSVMTYFKDLRGFFQWASLYQRSSCQPQSAEALHTISILDYTLEEALQISQVDIETYLYFLADTLGNEAATRNKKLIVVRSFYDYILDHQEALGVTLYGNPTSRIKKPRAEKKRPVFLPEEDQAAFLNAIDGENQVRDYALFLLMLSSGVRISESANANINDLDMSNRILRIRNGKGHKEGVAYLTEPCCAALRKYIEEYRDTIDGLDTPALFVSKRYRQRITTKAMENAMGKYILKAGLGNKGYTPHKLRHTTATMLAKEGKDSMVIKEVLRHEDISTSQLYMHLDQTDVANAVNTSSLSVLGAKEI